MLIRLRKPLRFRAAFAVVALYALGVLAPNAALAFGHGTAHCLTENTPAHVHMVRDAAPAHVHAGGNDDPHHHVGALQHDNDGTAPHQHPDHGKDSGTCCGLFCISAMALEPAEAFTAPFVRGPAPVVRADALAGRGPARIIRPPIA